MIFLYSEYQFRLIKHIRETSLTDGLFRNVSRNYRYSLLNIPEERISQLQMLLTAVLGMESQLRFPCNRGSMGVKMANGRVFSVI